MIHLLLRLSHRPTDAPNDDPPLNIEDLVRSEGVVPGTNFDWSSYLKQGWEKFQLPSIMANQQSSCDWTYELRNSILDIYDDEVVERFQCFLTQVSIIDANHPKYVHSALALAKIVYQPSMYR
ncbi:unnamed protein product [Nesidiocoris tenuis]|uniref:Uncharacterized protein n=1 Tax=Nesidiocoris tenuis TaxID=355587 RepID=A0A6H5H813_9HEMI|nr:unnamed protein product [Nesidiocoris tenuis]